MKFKGTKLDIQTAISKYGLRAREIKKIKDGMINSSFVVLADNGSRYVLRIYKKGGRTTKQISAELEMTGYFRKSGVPIPNIKKNLKDEFLTSFYDNNKVKWNAILMDFVVGRHLSSDDHNLISECAQYQSMMHKLALDYSTGKSKKSAFKDMIKWMKNERKNAVKKLNKNIALEFESIVDDIALEIDNDIQNISSLPASDVHLDYDSNNVITDGNHIKGIIDFDDMSCQPLVLDSAFSLWWWLFFNKYEDAKKIMELYVSGYEKNRNISESEKRLLPLFIRMRNATLAGLLFVNARSRPDLKSLKKAILFDSNLRSFKI